MYPSRKFFFTSLLLSLIRESGDAKQGWGHIYLLGLGLTYKFRGYVHHPFNPLEGRRRPEFEITEEVMPEILGGIKGDLGACTQMQICGQQP